MTREQRLELMAYAQLRPIGPGHLDLEFAKLRALVRGMVSKKGEKVKYDLTGEEVLKAVKKRLAEKGGQKPGRTEIQYLDRLILGTGST